MKSQLTIALGLFLGTSSAALAQNRPILYPYFLQDVNTVTVEGDAEYAATVPGESDIQPLVLDSSFVYGNLNSFTYQQSAGLAVSASAVNAPLGQCVYTGNAQVLPVDVLVNNFGPGVSYRLEGGGNAILVDMRSNHSFATNILAQGEGDGSTAGGATASFQTTDPLKISIPFGIRNDASIVSVLPGDWFFKRQTFLLPGSTTFSWRVVRDNNRNGKADVDDDPLTVDIDDIVITPPMPLTLNEGSSDNTIGFSAMADRGLYVLEVTLDTITAASAFDICDPLSTPGQQIGAAEIQQRLRMTVE